MSPEVAEAQSEIWAAENDLKQDAQLIGEKARMGLTPAEFLRRHPLAAIAVASLAAYLMYRALRRRSPANGKSASRE